MVTWKTGHRSPTTSTSSSCSLDLSALSRQLSLTCAVVLPAVTHSSLEEYLLCAKDLQIHIPGLNLFFELQTQYISSCLSVSTVCQVSENFYVQNTFCGPNSLLPRPVSSPPTRIPGAQPDTQLTCNCPLPLHWSHSYPPIHQ